MRSQVEKTKKILANVLDADDSQSHALDIWSKQITQDNLPVIIKLTKQDYLSPQAINYQKQEYQIIKSLNHAGIIKAYDLVSHEYGSAIVLENFQGSSLKSLIKEKPFSLTQILSISIQLVDAIAVIHDANIIHRNINPSNILYNPSTKEFKIIDPAGIMILRQACQQLQIWHSQGWSSLTMIVNLSTHQFASPNLLADIDRVLHETSIDPSFLKFEITESAILHRVEDAIAITKELRSRPNNKSDLQEK